MPLRSTQESSGRPLADSGLRCSACEYNLTGVVENRCPECGTAFNREQLLAMLAGAPAPIPIWDDTSQHVAVRFIKICLLTWFYPTKVGRMFPRRPSRASARRFRWAVVAPAFAIAVVSTLVVSGAEPAGLVVVVLGSIPVLVGVLVCEAILAAMMSDQQPAVSTTAPHANDLDAYDEWGGLIGLFRSFLLLQVLVVTATLLAEMSFRPSPWIAVPGILMFVVPFWWWGALSAAVWVRPAPRGSKIVMLVLLPGIVAFSVFVGGAVAVIVFSIAAWFAT